MENSKEKHQEKNQKDQPEVPLDSGSGQDTIELKRDAYEELTKKAKEFTELQDRLLRSAADFENAKKRLTKERDEYFKFALEGVILNLLPILDNYERALLHAQSVENRDKSVDEGFRLIHKQFINFLMDHGLKRIDTAGKHFDPHIHESVGYVVMPEKNEGTILEEMLAGYELGGKLIRAAKVKVAVKKPIKQPSEGSKEEELT